MPVASKRAEVVAQDDKVAEQFRGYLQELDYEVEVRRQVGATIHLGADIIVYHVSPDAANAERRSKARPRRRVGDDAPRFWLDAVHQLAEQSPDTLLLVAIPAGHDAADKALDSGATDVIEDTVSAKLFRRRLEMLELYAEVVARRARAARPASSVPRAARSGGSSHGVLDVPLPGLRNEQTGRIDARRVADYLGVPLRQLADAMQLPYARVHKTPDATSLQEPVAPIVRVLELADAAFGNRESVLMWMNRPLYELENDSPLAVILAGEGGAVETLLQNARGGIPG